MANVSVMAQRHEVLSEDIASLQVVVGDRWMQMPVTTLGGQEVRIEFDELSHEYHRYTYKVEQCNYDWTVNENLFASDYLEGFYDNNIIEENRISEDTYQNYTHYTLTFPNEQCRIKASGNYRVSVYDDNDDEDEPVLRAYFMVCENTAHVGIGVSQNTDIDFNKEHQQMSMTVTYNQLPVTDPTTQLHTVVMQNQRWDTAVWDARWQYSTRNELRWEHCRDLIFEAGNEYYKFETLDPTHTTMGLAQVGWDSDRQEWHAWVEPDGSRLNYLSDEDANGAFLIRNSDYDDCDVKCEYIQTHFELNAPQQNGEVYLNGNWTYDSFLPQYKMWWNEETKRYEATVMLKQGYYSYRYLLVDNNGKIGNISTERNFSQTENAYQVLVYFREQGGRSDRLVATSP